MLRSIPEESGNGRPDAEALPADFRTPTEEALKKKGILLCYNQFAPHYDNFQAMVRELDDIARLGYNAVWMSPLHPVSEHPKYNTKDNGRWGSIYAPIDLNRWRNDFFGTDDVHEQEEMLKGYTRRARELGLTPMFDLILNHMGRTIYEDGAAKDEQEERERAKKRNLVERGEDPELQGMDTRNWFKRHQHDDASRGIKKGDLVIDGVDTDKPDGQWCEVNGKRRKMDWWDDVAMFDYNDDTRRRQIIDHIWKPYVRKHFEELGFEGMRIDAAQKVHPEVLREVLGYAKEIHGSQPVVLAEALGSVTDDDRNRMKGCHITHITNGSFFSAPLKHMPGNWERSPGSLQQEWDEKVHGYSGLNANTYDMRQVVRCDKDTGGTVSLYDSHDHHSDAYQHRHFDRDKREQLLRERLAVATFYGDAGSIGCTGIDAANDRERSVFIHGDGNKKSGPNGDTHPIYLGDFIRELNMAHAAQRTADPKAYTERHFMNTRPGYVIMVTHDFVDGREETSLKIANTYNGPAPETPLTQDELNQLAQWSGKSADVFRLGKPEREKKGVFLCGKTGIDPQLTQVMLPDIATSRPEQTPVIS